MAAATKEQKPRQQLSNYEQETIINFNKDEQVAHIFTYEKTWQRHLERKLRLKPTLDNGHGGKGYDIPKDRIPMPRAKKVITAEHKAKLVKRLQQARKVKQEALL